MDNIAISVEHVKKIYKLYDRNRDRLKDALGFSKTTWKRALRIE